MWILHDTLINKMTRNLDYLCWIYFGVYNKKDIQNNKSRSAAIKINKLYSDSDQKKTMIITKDITVNFLNIRTPKKFVVITLKFELCGSTIE